MALKRTHIGILPWCVSAHPAFAQIDFFEILPRRCWIKVEQGALRQRQPYRAVDIALRDFIAALEPLVERLEHPAGLLSRFARAFQCNVIAARRGNDAELPFDQGEVLTVLPEQYGSEAVIIEGHGDLRVVRRRDQ